MEGEEDPPLSLPGPPGSRKMTSYTSRDLELKHCHHYYTEYIFLSVPKVTESKKKQKTSVSIYENI